MKKSRDATAEMLRQGDEHAWSEIYQTARLTRNAAEFLALVRQRKRSTVQPPEFPRTVRIAVLGGATTQTLLDPLKLAIEAVGLGCEIYEGEYNTFAQEMLAPSEALLSFRPEITLALLVHSNISTWPASVDTPTMAQSMALEQAQHLFDLCERYHTQTGSDIILNNFSDVPHTPFGNLSAKTPADPNNYISRVNLCLGDLAPHYVHVNDVAGMSAYYGVRHWHDARYWFHAKQPVSFDCLLPYVRNTAGVVAALFGKALKCLALDLDNTLWGGVIGDDGVGGIRLGEGDAVGEAYKAFQEYLLRLKERGVLLAVCSKNEMENALAPFEQHPEMRLSREDIVSFKANWDPKPDNLRAIAAELSIGLEAIGFVDDNPAERDLVRQWTPEVTVFDLTDDPADYPRILQDSAMLESVALSAEDAARTATYRQNAERQTLLGSSGDYQQYLESLQQSAVISRIGPSNLNRVTQLVNKSNQFNLTTLRRSRSQIEALLNDANTWTFTIRLEDRFGDNGLICVCWGHRENQCFYIDQLLMSCRVLKRGVEQLLCNHLVEQCRAAGVRTLVGRYISTPKNRMVADFYPTLGFQLTECRDDKSTQWELGVADFAPLDVAIDFKVQQPPSPRRETCGSAQ